MGTKSRNCLAIVLSCAALVAASCEVRGVDSVEVHGEDGGGDGGSGGDGGGGDGGGGGETWVDPAAGPSCSAEFGLDLGLPINVLGARVVAGRADLETLAVLDDLIGQLEEVGGPWDHHVVGPWRGTLGEPLEAPESAGADGLEAASVPDVVVDDDGRFWAFFVDGDLEAMRAAAERGEPLTSGWTGLAGLGAAFSDDGESWERFDLEISGDDVPLLLVDPDLIRLPDGRWRLYVLGIPAETACADMPDPALAPGPHDIWFAESDDLVHWVAGGVAWEAPGGTADPAVWCESQTDCAALVPRNPQPVAASSTDGGKTFIAHAIDLPDGPMSMPDVARVGETWWMVAQGEHDELRSMWSSDGWAWTEGGAPGFEAAGPTIVALADETLLWVHVEGP